MIEQTDLDSTDGIIATIENQDNPSQTIALKYLPDEKAFVTSGIQVHFGEKEISIPAHLVVIDFELMGTIVSAILEKLSSAQEQESTFEYSAKFEVLGKKYNMTEQGGYMAISQVEDEERQ